MHINIAQEAANGNLELNLLQRLHAFGQLNITQKFNHQTALVHAIIHGPEESAVFLVHHMQTEQVSKEIYYQDDYFSYMAFAANFGRTNVMEALNQRHGISYNSTYADHSTMMHAAAQGNQLETMRWLANEKNVPVNVRADDGMSPMHLAAANGNTTMMCWLHHQHNIPYHVQTRDNNNIITFAEMGNHKSTVINFIRNEVRSDRLLQHQRSLRNPYQTPQTQRAQRNLRRITLAINRLRSRGNLEASNISSPNVQQALQQTGFFAAIADQSLHQSTETDPTRRNAYLS